MSDWEPLTMDPHTLLDARLQLHWAAQVAAAVGKQLLPPQADFSEQSLEWRDGPRVLAQGLVHGAGDGAQPFRSAIRPYPPALLLLGPADEILRELPLAGQTLDAAYDWMRREVEALVGRPLAEPLARSEGIPSHPVATGAPFAFPDAAAAAEVSHYIADAYLLLKDLMAREDSSHVRCWPHHFDIAILIQVDEPGTDPEHARSLGVGLSPGDDAIPRPYFYLLPWPRPARPAESLPALDGGGWHTEGWLGAVLDSTEFAGTADPQQQRQRCERFLNSAVAACYELLEEPR
jgi:hypothetical protein